MKIDTVALEDQQTRLTAEIEPELFDKYKRQAARKISQSQKIPGFRPGKAPYDMVLRIYGDEALTQEAIELMLDEIYPKVIEEAGITPSGPGKLEEMVKTDPPTFSFIVPLPPTVVLGDYQEIRKDYAPPEVTDEQVEATIRRLLRSYSTAEPVERAAQQGDLVSFKLSARRLNPQEGENETLVEERSYQMVAGEEDEDQDEPWPYEGFTGELTGLSENDTKVVPHTFGEESPYEDLRGKEAEFTIVVENVKEMHLPELNDEFAQSLGEFETVEALRSTIRTQLEQNQSQQYDENYFEALFEELVAKAAVKYPPFMLEEEIDDFVHRVEHNLEHDRLDLETYLKLRDMTRETFVETEVKPAAEKRLLRSLVLDEFAKQEKIEVKNEEIESIYYSALQQMQQSPDLKQVRAKRKQSSREMANSLAVNTVNNIFNRRLMGRLKAIATGKGEEEVEALENVVEDAAESIEEVVDVAESATNLEEAPAPRKKRKAVKEQKKEASELLAEDSQDEESQIRATDKGAEEA